MKKMITLLLIVALLTSVVACGGTNDEKSSGSEEKITGSITEQEDKSSEVEEQPESTQPESASDVVVAPKSPYDPAPLVDRKVEGLTQEQVSEVCKFIYFTMGVPYEEMDIRILDDSILFYWEELESFKEQNIDPYEGLELYFVEKNDIEWPVADYITEGTKYTGAGNVIEMYNPYTESKDGYDCWRVYIDVASVDEVAAYINALKAEGFAFATSFLYPEEVAPGTFDFLGMYEWQGVADDGRCIQFMHTQAPTTEFGTDPVQLIINLYSQNPNS